MKKLTVRHATEVAVTLLASVAMLVSLAACATSSKEGASGQERQPTVRLGWVKSTANLAAYLPSYHPEEVAEGITLEPTLFTTAVDIQTALVGGQLDVGILTPVHLLRAAEKGNDLIQIAGNTRGNTGILFSKELGLEQDNWDGLKTILSERKLKIATSRGSINEALAIAEFSKYGIDVNTDVELINIANFGQHAEGVRLGEFDGVFTLEAVASLMVIDDIATLFNKPYDTEAGDINTIFVANRSWAEKNPETVTAFVQTIANSSAKLANDPEFNVQIGLEHVGLDKEIIELALENNRYEIANGLDETKALAEIQFGLGLVSRDLTSEIEGYMTDQYLDEVKH